MKRNLAVLAGTVALGLLGLGVVMMSRPNAATAARADKEPEAAAPKIAVSKITAVTVYPDSALVTREVEVPAGNGLVELVVSPLPETVVSSSLYTEAAEGLRVLTTRFRSRPVKEDTREEVRKLEDEIRKLQVTQRKIVAETKALDANMALMTKMEGFATASTVHATEKGKIDSAEAIALAKYLMEGRVEKAKAALELAEQAQLNREAMEFATRKMNNLTGTSSKIERDAVIVIDKAAGGAGKVKLNYLVSAAAWSPQYKFRAGKTTKDPVVVEYLAAVVQQTGEDWERVQISLSTAQPMLSAAPPELLALSVSVTPRGTATAGVSVSGLQTGLNQALAGGPNPAPGSGPMGQAGMGGGGGFIPGGRGGQFGSDPGKLSGNRLSIANPGEGARPEELLAASKALREQSQAVANLRNNDKDASELANYAGVLDQVRDLVVTTGKGKDGRGSGGKPSKNEGPSVNYTLAGRLSIPSRQDEQVVEVSKIDLEPDYFYKAVPILSPNVYRQANLVNKSKNVLLPGEATMYNGSDFVGRMTLPLVAVGESFTVGFGTEPQLQVTRQMMDRNRTMQAGNQILKYEYRILVSSYKTEKVKVQIWDRLPTAEKEAMGVTVGKVSPALCADPVYVREERSNNLLRWDLDVEPEMRGEKAMKVNYEFQLELDRQATIGSFQTK